MGDALGLPGARFSIALTAQEKADLIAFLAAL